MNELENKLESEHQKIQVSTDLIEELRKFAKKDKKEKPELANYIEEDILENLEFLED